MVRLTPNDAAVLSRLVQFGGLPAEELRKMLNELDSPEAKKVGEAVLDKEKYQHSTVEIQATVDRFLQWLKNNRRLGRQRPLSRRLARAQ